jgi:ATP-binding cassette subfamily B protein
MGTFRRLLTYLTKYRVQLFVVLLCIVVANALTMVAPLFVQQIFDVFLPQGDVPTLTLYAVAIIGAMLLSGALNYVLRYVNESVSQRSVYDLRNDLYEALLGQSFSFYDRTSGRSSGSSAGASGRWSTRSSPSPSPSRSWCRSTGS